MQLEYCHRPPQVSESNIHFPFCFNTLYRARKSRKQIKHLIQKQGKHLANENLFHGKCLRGLVTQHPCSWLYTAFTSPACESLPALHEAGGESPSDLVQHYRSLNLGNPQEYEPLTRFQADRFLMPAGVCRLPHMVPANEQPSASNQR